MFAFRRKSEKPREELAPWVGIALGALYMGAVLGVAFAALKIHYHEIEQTRVESAVQWTQWLSRYLSSIHERGPEELEAEIRNAVHETGITYCALVQDDGVIAVHSDPTHTKQTLPPTEWIATSQPGIRISAAPDQDGLQVISARVAGSDSSRPDYQLVVGLSDAAFTLRDSRLVVWVGYISLAVLCLYLVLYHLLRRALNPLAAIRDRLLELDEPIEARVQSLCMNQSFDQISTSWNRLIGFVGEMQDELRRANLNTDMSSAMDGYRSERLTEILMQIPFGVLVIDPDHTISFANRVAVGMISAEGEPLDNVSADEVMDEPLRLAILSPEVNAKSNLSAASRWTDYTFKRVHGDVVLRFWSIPSGSGDMETIIFVQDVTQAKEAEQARDQFLYHVTHELRTPLTNIRAYAETLSQGVIDDEQTIRECYNIIMGETQRLSRLVEDILNVSQLEVGTARLQAVDLKLDKLLRTVVQDQQGSADGKNIDLVLHLPAKSPVLRGDKDRLNVVFSNLVGNAIKYTPNDGRVDVRCSVEQNRVRITFTDTGIGIDPKDQDKIFDKFFRVDDEVVSAISGTGLGLAIAQETVRVHGGTISVESAPGQGSTFTVTLPAIHSDSESTEDAPAPSVEEH